jgi:hypothetical protein
MKEYGTDESDRRPTRREILNLAGANAATWAFIAATYSRRDKHDKENAFRDAELRRRIQKLEHSHGRNL